MTYQELEIQINNLIARDEIEGAIALLTSFSSGHEKLKDIVLQSGMFHSLKKAQRSGVIDYATVQQQLNQLRVNILDFLNYLKEAGRAQETTPKGKRGMANEFKPALAKVAVLLVLKKAVNKGEELSITDIYERIKTTARKHIYASVKRMEELELIDRQKKGRINYWKLTKKGMKLSTEFEASLSSILKEN